MDLGYIQAIYRRRVLFVLVTLGIFLGVVTTTLAGRPLVPRELGWMPGIFYALVFGSVLLKAVAQACAVTTIRTELIRDWAGAGFSVLRYAEVLAAAAALLYACVSVASVTPVGGGAWTPGVLCATASVVAWFWLLWLVGVADESAFEWRSWGRIVFGCRPLFMMAAMGAYVGDYALVSWSFFAYAMHRAAHDVLMNLCQGYPRKGL